MTTAPVREPFLVRACRRLLHRALLGRLGAGQPVPTAALDREYASGHWDHFEGGDEESRYAMIARLVRKRSPYPRVLDVGCGSGRLASLFSPVELGGYLGVDISPEGLRRAEARRLPHGHFILGNFETWRSPDAWDVIVFNEVIGYARWPAEVVSAFASALAPGGRVIISYYRDGNHDAIWRRVVRGWRINQAETLAGAGGRVWDIKVLSVPAAI